MAIDVIVRPTGGCISIVCDRLDVTIRSVAIRGSTIHATLSDGMVMEIGNLADSMKADAGRCSICIVIEMDGDTVIGSRKVDFSMSDLTAA
ncbi:hypothetical protein G6L37_03485 [Agrobacterium rubi]|nr:hypothetical protein [Agrobacterium rubi]NTF24434.1 hypothetical protein [Agrobacterium rubi]